MSVDERLRIGLSRNALSLEPDVDAFLATAMARRRRSRRIRWAGAIAGLVAAACAAAVLVLSAAWGDRDAPVVPADSPTSSVAAQGRYAGEVIPDGTWVREITTAEITRRGLDLAPEEITSNYLDDGSTQVMLKTQGARWSILVQDDAGEFEVGDLGDTSYDPQGRWVQSSDITGSALLLVWEIHGDALTTSGLTSPDGQPIDQDGTHLFTEGTWQRQS